METSNCKLKETHSPLSFCLLRLFYLSSRSDIKTHTHPRPNAGLSLETNVLLWLLVYGKWPVDYERLGVPAAGVMHDRNLPPPYAPTRNPCFN